jgi:hypothetical protein
VNILGLAVRTRGGVFGPGGYGGGIFDGSGMGFGGLGQYEQAAAGVRGLGDEFDDWLAEQQTASGPAYTSGGAPTIEGPGAPSSTPTTTSAVTTYPWNTYSSATYSLQGQVNGYLSTLNKQPITQDGYLGPETCGAIDFLKAQGVSILKPSTCQSSSYDPTLVYGTPDENTPAPVTATTPSTYTGPSASSTTASLTTTSAGPTSRAGMSPTAIGLGIAAVVGLGMFAMSRKKKAS